MSVADTQEPVRGQVRWRDGLATLSLAQRGRLTLWLPVFLALGIGIYFGLPVEPGAPFWLTLALTVAALCLVARLLPVSLAPLAFALACIGAGMGIAKLHVEGDRAPVLGFRYYGPIEGRIVGLDRSASDAVRLTLDRVRLERMAPDRTPARVRVSLHGDQPLADLAPGDHVMTTGHLSPPSGPAEPGGFDFQRHMWTLGIGAVGYTRNPVLRAGPGEAGGIGQRVFAARMALSRAVQDTLPGEPGAFAAAILTGDRSGMGRDTLQTLRDSNLAHLLAISGLHMGLLTGFVFAAIRTLAALVPPLALRWPVKKTAAVAALLAGAAYLALSGGNVATERAYIMVSVMFVAVLLDRRALTLRAVAIAATIVLLIAPEALVGPGFQMSFAATTALVVVFRAMRGIDMSGLPRLARGTVAVVISSFVAGMATAPIAAAHFNQIAHYGLLANVVSVPLMGVLVMPAAVLAAVLAPFGLAWIGLALMAFGLRWILWVAQAVAGQEGAVGYVVTPSIWVLPIIALGALFGVLWQGRLRWAGLAPVLAAFLLWSGTQRPAGLVADTGGLVGVLTPEGRALSRGTGNGFAAGIWLENDGAPVPQDVAAARWGVDPGERLIGFTVGEVPLLQVRGKTALAELGTVCGGAAVLIVTVVDETPRDCAVYDLNRLRAVGSLAIHPMEGGLRIVSARTLAGLRPWNSRNGEAVEPPRLIGAAVADQ